jgi:hypothetical protein
VRIPTIFLGFKVFLSLSKVCIICLAELFLILGLSTISVKWLLHLVHLYGRKQLSLSQKCVDLSHKLEGHIVFVKN